MAVIKDNLVAEDFDYLAFYNNADPALRAVLDKSYITPDLELNCKNYENSGEFQEIARLLNSRRGDDAILLDIGAGNGIATSGFLKLGFKVIAMEPCADDIVGRGAIAKLGMLPRELVLDGVAEKIALPDQSVNFVFTRQVLHHIIDTESAMKEISRVLKPGGTFIAVREHVVDNDQQLQEFLRSHPTHTNLGEEHAHPLERYLSAIRGASLEIDQVLGPWDSIINTSPMFDTQAELNSYPSTLLSQRLGKLGSVIAKVPGVSGLVWPMIKSRRAPGRLYSFVAKKN